MKVIAIVLIILGSVCTIVAIIVLALWFLLFRGASFWLDSLLIGSAIIDLACALIMLCKGLGRLRMLRRKAYCIRYGESLEAEVYEILVHSASSNDSYIKAKVCCYFEDLEFKSDMWKFRRGEIKEGDFLTVIYIKDRPKKYYVFLPSEL